MALKKFIDNGSTEAFTKEENNLDEAWHLVLRTPEGICVIANILEIMGYAEPSWRPDATIHRTTALKDMAEHLLQHVEILNTGYADAIINQIRQFRSE